MSGRVFVGGQWRVCTIDYTCHRCLCVQPSGRLPTVSVNGVEPLAVYPLPSGWTLIVRPLGEDDWLRCVECQKDVSRGSPEVLG